MEFQVPHEEYNVYGKVSAKEQRLAVGSNQTKGYNFKEKQKRVKNRSAKLERIRDKTDMMNQQNWSQEQDEKYAPVDKHDARHMKKQKQFFENQRC